MGINQLTLSPELISMLYPESMVVEKDGVAPAYPILGKNGKSICFLVSHPDHDFNSTEQYAFISKILAACKCSMDDIALINTARHPVTLHGLKNQLHPKIIFLWGSRPATIGEISDFQDLTISEFSGISVIPVFSADLMMGDNPAGLARKQQLWVLLKKLFNL
jgi:hypothetical protein